MGSLERSKKRVHLCKKAAVHFLLCFVMGFFTGFAPKFRPSVFSGQIMVSNQTGFSQQLTEMMQPTRSESENVNRSLISQTPVTVPESSQESSAEPELVSRRQLIVITPTSRTCRRSQVVFLRRLANTLALVPPPLLWIVVEARLDSPEVSETLRKTEIMYRHLVYKGNFTDPEAEMDHQRNVALNHIEHHRLSGIVHFAELSNVYDLGFFNEIRNIEVVGAWPMASLSANRNKVHIDGPVCDDLSQVIGWHISSKNQQMDSVSPVIHISGFAFNSSVLWDPERWGRSSLIQDDSQNSINFVKQVVVEDESKLRGIPPEGCSTVMLWRLRFPCL